MKFYIVTLSEKAKCYTGANGMTMYVGDGGTILQKRLKWNSSKMVSTFIVKNRVEGPQKIQNKMTLQSSNPTTGCICIQRK